MLLERVGGRIFARCWAVLCVEADAEEGFQEAFCALFRHRSKLPTYRAAVAWLYQTATNSARMQRRRLWRSLLREQRSVAAAPAGTEPGDDLTRREQREAVAAALADLPMRERRADGKILLVGRKRTGGTWGRSDIYLTRLEANGSLDRTFGNRGIVNLDLGNGSERLEGVAVRPDGKIVVAGDPGPLGMGLARLNPDGALDATFGVGGRVVAADGGMRDAYEVALQPWDGTIVASGAAGSSLSDYAVARFLTDAGAAGTIDGFSLFAEDNEDADGI